MLITHTELLLQIIDYKINDVTNVPAYSRLKQDYVNFFLQATFGLTL